MYRIATITAMDVLEDVWVTLHLKEYAEHPPGSTPTTTTLSVQVRGTGEDDGRQWARDALIALVEGL